MFLVLVRKIQTREGIEPIIFLLHGTALSSKLRIPIILTYDFLIVISIFELKYNLMSSEFIHSRLSSKVRVKYET